jgi:hypothetical protein
LEVDREMARSGLRPDESPWARVNAKEFSMKPLRAVADQPLEWTKGSGQKREYELRAGQEVVALLRWDKAFGSLAAATASEGEWTFKRSGFFSPRVTTRLLGSETEVLVFKPTWRCEGTVECSSGARFRWLNTGFWRSEWTFASENGDPLVHFKLHSALLKQSAEVRVEPGAASLPELSLLALLGWYVLVLMSQDAGATAAGAAVAAAAG